MDPELAKLGGILGSWGVTPMQRVGVQTKSGG